MEALKLNIGKTDINIGDEVLLNSVLNENPKMIKRLIKSISPFYKINENYFDIVNPFIDYNIEGQPIYAGLIIRTNKAIYAILYLEGHSIDEENALLLIEDYIRDIDDFHPKEIKIDTFKIKRKSLKKVLPNLE